MRQYDNEWELKLKSSPVNRKSSAVDLNRSIDQILIKHRNNKRLRFTLTGIVAILSLLTGVFAFQMFVLSPGQIYRDETSMLPGTQDIPLYKGLRRESDSTESSYVATNTSLEDIHTFYKEMLPQFGWTIDGENSGNNAGIPWQVSVWFNESKQRWLRVSLYKSENQHYRVVLEDNFPIAQAVKVMKPEEVDKEAPKELKDWVLSQLQDPNWRNSVFHLSGKTYALIKTSSSNLDSVSYESAKFHDKSVTLFYKTFDNHGPTPDVTDYLLIQFNLNYDVEFINSYSTDK